MKRRMISLVLVIGIAAPALAQGGDDQHPWGRWKNPFNSVHMEVSPCGELVCGKVVYATDKAKADAAKGGNPDFMGVNLLQDFKRTGNASWAGKVFVPDLNHRFNGELTLEEDDSLLVKGCAVGKVGCKHQVWTRVPID